MFLKGCHLNKEYLWHEFRNVVVLLVWLEMWLVENFSVERALNKHQFLLYRVYQQQKRCFENMSVIFRLKVK